MTRDKAGKKDIELRTLVHPVLFISLVLALPFGMGTAPAIFRDGDTSWQIAAGEWILRHGAIPTTDPFSFTAAGHPWVAMEWLSEVILAATFRLAGHAGLAAVVASAVIGVHAIIYFYLEKRVPSALLAATLVMMDLVLARFILARPHVLAWPLIAGWTVLLLSYAERGRPPPLWSALLLTVWTNIHASFPLAIPILAAIALDSLMASRWANFRQWLLFGIASLIAISLNANGIDGLRQPFNTSMLSMLPLIGEWRSSAPPITPTFYAALLLGLGALLWKGTRVPVGRLLLLLALLLLAFAHVRHQSSFIIVAACVLPPLFPAKRPATAVPKWFLLCAVPMLAFRLLWPLTPPETEGNPRHLIAAIPPELRNQPVFNEYSFGGPLILAGIRPYIDGRAEIYGDAFVKDYVHIYNGDVNAFNRAVRRYGIRWTMLSNGNKSLIADLESSGEWQRIYADRVGVIDVRRTGPADRAESASRRASN